MTILSRRWVLPAVPVALLATLALVLADPRESDARRAGDCARAGLTAGVHSVSFGGVVRPYLLALPADYGRRSAYPLVLNFPGWGGTKEKTEANTRLGQVGADRGYLVVTPDATGTPKRWNWQGQPGLPDDYAFVHALVSQVRRQACVDPRRIYATGHSNGAAFASQLVCRAPHEFAAVAMVSATVPAACPPGIAPAVLAIHGTADPSVPYAGEERSRRAVPAAVDVVADYAKRYHCRIPAARTTEPAPGISRLRYTGCDRRADVVLDSVVGGRHPWPGSAQATADPLNSPAGRTFDATDAILDFFDRRGGPTKDQINPNRHGLAGSLYYGRTMI
jgi:polyhydroxybutyrate depolymerase